MKTLRAKGLGFAAHSGLIDIGRNYKQDIWAIELRWCCPLIHAWSFRLWRDKQKPTKKRIAICGALSPVVMLLHWLVAVPLFAVLYAVCFTGLSLTMGLGWVFSWLGGKLEKIGKI